MRFFSVLVALASVVHAAPSSTIHHVVHERRAAEPLGWTLSRRLESHKVLPMRFGLTQSNMDRIEEMLMSVSHPDSPTYGQHFSAAKVVETFSPSSETIEAVTNWLTDSGISRDRLRLAPNNGWIHLNATVAEVEELLKTEYHVYSHPSGDEQLGNSIQTYREIFGFHLVTFLGCQTYSVPAHVKEHIDLIKPTVHFNHRPSPKFGGLGSPTLRPGPKKSNKQVKTPPSLENCDENITLDCLRALYSINYKPVETKKNTFGIGKLETSFQVAQNAYGSVHS